MKRHGLVLWGLLLSTLTARAADSALAVLVCYPAAAVSARDAEPALNEMVSVIESIGGWPAGTVKTQFTTRLTDCEKKLASWRPAFAILPLGVFLRHAESHQLEPLVQPKVGGSCEESYHLVVRRGTFKSIEELKGRRLGGPWLEDAEFLRRVVFGGKLDPRKDFQLVPAKRALKALRALAAGKLDAVLLSRQQAKSLGELPFGKDLEVVFSSPPLPQVGIAADRRRVTEAERLKMQQAMEAMCGHEKGKKLCELFNIESFVKAGPDTYAKVIEQWRAVP